MPQVNVDDGFLNLMTNDGTSKDDVKIPEGDLGKQIQEDFDAGKELIVTIVAAMGEEQAISVKEAPKTGTSLLYSRDSEPDANVMPLQVKIGRSCSLMDPLQHACILFHGFCTLFLYQIAFNSLNQHCMLCVSENARKSRRLRAPQMQFERLISGCVLT